MQSDGMHMRPKITLTKLVYNQLATQDRKHTTGGKAWVHNKCPFCPESDDTFQHSLRCQHPSAIKFCSNLLNRVTSTCHTRRAPQIASWLRNEIPSIDTLDQRLHRLHAAQSEIGWDLMIRGFFAEEWSHVVRSYHPHRTKQYDHNFLFPKLIHNNTTIISCFLNSSQKSGQHKLIFGTSIRKKDTRHQKTRLPSQQHTPNCRHTSAISLAWQTRYSRPSKTITSQTRPNSSSPILTLMDQPSN
jgi:hypothetical protein